MQPKQKVTLYLPSDLHHRLKVRAAVDLEPMSDLAERAIDFYLAHPEVVEEQAIYGCAHRVYGCPECTSSLVMRDGQLLTLSKQSTTLTTQEAISVESVKVSSSPDQHGEETLVPC
ncbi:hypothetical protein DO97_03045 [Neosynechococcus sphagnicola sy1]|uniref:Uncharacterized protein n=1 Tax=Neosynechococcus sphagnicola sy1 TaxID=1497020 RepID=A0A098TL53_9CYAN|nr:hypothetical protein [Neosynechococcus sphagnicola]KGF73029.1 hypothetical protein DO97_03045 [Neosynechococcus sphagnicola sy1]